MKKIYLFLISQLISVCCYAETWDEVVNSGNYYYGIQIKQLYNSATYGDIGYLYLMVDMTDADKPQIKVRTWQPNQTPLEDLFHSGDFYR